MKNKEVISHIVSWLSTYAESSGVKGFDGFVDYAEKMSPLGNASAEDCANYCVTMFSDLTKMVTMQNLFHDGGFSFTGVSQAVVEKMEK